MLVPVAAGLVHYLVNKPDGLITTADDPQGRPTVMTLVPPEPRVFPVGRLDRRTEGLLIMTNDGALAQLLTHPSHGVPKEYVAEVSGGTPAPGALRALRQGVELDDGPTAPAEVGVLAPGVLAPRHPRGPQPPGPAHVRGGGPSGAPPRAHPYRTGARHEPGPGAVAPPDGRRGPLPRRRGRSGRLAAERPAGVVAPSSGEQKRCR